MHAGATPTIFKKAAMLRNSATKEEQKLWEFLKTKPCGFKFRRQHPFGIFILDFYCHSKRLSIEVDGPNHNRKAQVRYDSERTEFINSFNITELRFANDEINNEISKVQNAILETLQSNS